MKESHKRFLKCELKIFLNCPLEHMKNVCDVKVTHPVFPNFASDCFTVLVRARWIRALISMPTPNRMRHQNHSDWDLYEYNELPPFINILFRAQRCLHELTIYTAIVHHSYFSQKRNDFHILPHVSRMNKSATCWSQILYIYMILTVQHYRYVTSCDYMYNAPSC